MAANRNRYSANKLEVYKDGVTYSTLVAKMATDYTNEATIKQIFKLDYVHKVNDGQFIGGVLTSGSNNLKFHDTKNLNVDGTANSKGDAVAHQRLSHLRVKAADGNTYALFNDAGLNTKPDCSFMNLKEDVSEPNTPLFWANYPKSRIGVEFNEARFLNTTDRVVRVSKGSIKAESSLGVGTMNTRTTKDQFVDLGQFVEGDSVTVTLITTNPEGTITTNKTSVPVGRAVALPEYWEYRDISETDLWLINPTSKMDLYMFETDAAKLGDSIGTSAGSAASLNIRMYTDDRMDRARDLNSNMPPNGWYITQGTNAYYLKNGVVQSRRVVGQVTKKTVISPAIINGTIYIMVTNASLSSAVIVEQLVYYDAIDGKINGVPQTLNITIPSGTAIGTSINTGITPTMVQNYARFQLSSSYLVDNPIVDLTKASDGEQVLPK